MKYYNFETMFISLAAKIGDYLHENNIYFEISKNDKYYHFEILTDPAGAELINNFLDNNTIWCKGVTTCI
jgi:ADP-heptose:LPS heptosyltransferase